MGEAVQDTILDDDFIEQDFNDSLEDLQKSLKSETDEQVRKTKEEDEEYKRPLKKKRREKEPEGMMDEEDSEEDEDAEYEKSISEYLQEDPEAAVSMDVEPFLRQLAKSIDESNTATIRYLEHRLDAVEAMVKSQGQVLLHTAKLEKSTSDMIRKIGGQPVQSNSQKILRKSRFEGTDGSEMEVDNREILQKSIGWVRSGKLNIQEAGKLEGRINKGILGKVKDGLYTKVSNLMKEGK